MSSVVVLLVDDEKMVLDSLRQQITSSFRNQLTVETAEDAEEAWEVLDDLAEDQTTVILVVSDWLMPRIRGDEFLADVRARHPQITRVMLTGQADQSVLDRVRRDDVAHRLLFKPWSADDLRDAVRSALAS